jgi:hypothetical protein
VKAIKPSMVKITLQVETLILSEATIMLSRETLMISLAIEALLKGTKMKLMVTGMTFKVIEIK